MRHYTNNIDVSDSFKWVRALADPVSRSSNHTYDFHLPLACPKRSLTGVDLNEMGSGLLVSGGSTETPERDRDLGGVTFRMVRSVGPFGVTRVKNHVRAIKHCSLCSALNSLPIVF